MAAPNEIYKVYDKHYVLSKQNASISQICITDATSNDNQTCLGKCLQIQMCKTL